MANKITHTAARGILTAAALALTPFLATTQAANAGWEYIPAWGAPVANGTAFVAPHLGATWEHNPSNIMGAPYPLGATSTASSVYPYRTGYPAGTVVWVPVMVGTRWATSSTAAAPALGRYYTVSHPSYPGGTYRAAPYQAGSATQPSLGVREDTNWLCGFSGIYTCPLWDL